MHAPPSITPAPSRVVRALAPSLERFRLRAYLLMMVGDILCLLACFFLAGGLYHGDWPDEIAMVQAQLLLLVFLTIALYQGAYSIKALSDLDHAVMRLLLVLAVAAALLIFVTFYAKSTTSFSRVSFTMGLCFSAIAMIGLRFGLIHWIRGQWGPSVLNTILIMDGGPKIELRDSFVDEAARATAMARIRRQLAFGEATIPQSSGIPMSLAMLKECQARGMGLGRHGRNHVPLPKLGDRAAHAEITGGRADLAAITGIEAPAFAYPHGEHDGRIRALVESAGYAFAVDTREDLVEPRRYDLFALPRIAAGNCSGKELCERIAALGG